MTDSPEFEVRRLRNAISIAIGRMERCDFSAATMGLKAARGDFADKELQEDESEAPVKSAPTKRSPNKK